MAPNFDLELLVNSLPLNLTGADLYALANDALMIAVGEFIGANKNENLQAVPKIVVENKHFVEALKKLKPSVSFQELKHYQDLQSRFKSQ